MLKKLFFATVLAFSLSMLVFSQEQQGGMEMKGTPAKTKAAKQSRLEGIVIRSNKDKSELTAPRLFDFQAAHPSLDRRRPIAVNMLGLGSVAAFVTPRGIGTSVARRARGY